jgi:hypothetical protein
MDKLLIRVLGGPAGADAALPAVASFGIEGGTIGRAETSTLVLSDPERSVSRMHARVDWRDGAHHIFNLGINPVLCNGTVLTTGAESPLAVGDELRIGRFTLVVEVDATPVAVPLHLQTQPMPAPATVGEDPFTPDLLLDTEEGEGGATDDDEPLFDDMTGLPLPRRGKSLATRGPPSPQELWLAELLRGMGCAAPTWPAPLTPEQVVQVGALMRSAMNETMRDWLKQFAPSVQRLWFDAFEQAFLKACKAGLPAAPHDTSNKRAS